MEKFSHSRQPSMLPKKSTVATVNTIYDDVFGGPPRYGAPTKTTLSPRVDDYSEIFGGFHAPRATSIPVLDLPVADETEVFFDVRSSAFEYSEVFGGFDDSDFAVSFEELMMNDQSNGRDDGSSDEAWTPEAEYLSEESDHSHSAKKQHPLSGDSSESIPGSTEFNISYYQVSRRSNENMENVITKVIRPTASECSFAVDQTFSSTKIDGEHFSLQQLDDACFSTTAFVSSEGRKEKDLRKTLSQPARGDFSGPLYEDEGRSRKGYVRNSSLPNEMFLTISDLSLRTQPSELPPPSRPPPPPALDARKGCSTKPTPAYKCFLSKGSVADGSPPYCDLDVDATSSTQASAATVLEAMKKAHAKLESAKESMERKEEGLRGPTKPHLNNESENYEDMGADGCLPYCDSEVDSTSSPKASAAAILEVMEKAYAKLKSAKESMERKEGLHGPIKLHVNNERENYKGKGADGSQSYCDLEVDATSSAKASAAAKAYAKLKEPMERKKEGLHGPTKPCLNNERENYEGNGADGSPPYHDLDVDATSSAKTSAAAKAYAKLKESMERKKEDLHGPTKPHLNNEREKYKGKGTRSFDTHSITGESGQGTGESGQGTGERVGSRMDFHVFEESRELARENLVIPETLDGKRQQTVSRNSEEEKNGRESMSSQGSDKTDEAAEWKEETDFFELVSTNKLRKYSVDQNVTGSDKRQTKIDDSRKYENMVEGQYENNRVEMMKSLKHKEKMPEEKEAYRSMDYHRNISCENEDSGNSQCGSFEEEIEEQHNLLDEQVENERMSNDKIKQEKAERMEVDAGWEENQKKMRQAYGTENGQRKLRETFKQEETDRLKEALSKEESDRRQREASKCEENKQKLGKTCESIEDEMKKQEVSKEENGTRQCDTCESEGNEKRLKEALEQEESERRPKLISDRIEKEMRVREGFGKESSKRRTKINIQSETGKRLEEVDEHDDMSKFWQEVQEEEESEKMLGQRHELEIGSTTEQAIKLQQSKMPFNKTFKSMEQKKPNDEGRKNCRPLNEEYAADTRNNFGRPQLSGEKQEGTQESAHQETEKIPTELHNGKIEAAVQRNSKTEAAIEPTSMRVDGKTDICSTTKGNTENCKLPCPVKGLRKEVVDGYFIGKINGEKINSGLSLHPDVAPPEKLPANEPFKEGKSTSQSHVRWKQGDNKGSIESSRVVKASAEIGKTTEVSRAAKFEEKGSTQHVLQHANQGKSNERELKSLNQTSEEKTAENIRREKELESLRKMEEEMEREREREKDRMAVDRTILEARDNALFESRERAERAAVERAMTEARERLEKACAEARERSTADKTSVEARLKAERSAVERAAAEARERAFEKVMAERAAFEGRDKVVQDPTAGSFNGSKSAYSINYNGIEGESTQRCRARLERFRRTAERAAQALAEKTKRDLLVQREQAERNRIAEALDADVKRWSSGKEGNLRALLSTLQYILGPNSGWQPVPLTEVITSAAVKRAYRKAMLCVHPDKLQQRGASIQQKYICEKVFDLLKEAWNKFNSEER